MPQGKTGETKFMSPEKGLSLDQDDVFFQVSNLRRAIPQFIATFAQSLLLLSIGMIVASPTIVLGALHRTVNKNDDLSFDDSQASWFGSIVCLCQPIGSLSSLFIQGYLGRRRCMLLVNFPLILGWYLLYAGETVNVLFTSALISGLTIGFMEAPVLAYVGEISEPRLRGTLTCISNTHVAIGFLVEFIIGTVIGQENWRTTMMISIVVPAISILAIYQIPESPNWLISKGRSEEALQALCWLRGWVEEKAVTKEFQALVRYNEHSQRTNRQNNTIYRQVPTKAYIHADGSGTVPAAVIHPPKESIKDKLKDVLRPAFIRPLRLVLLYMVFTHSGSMNAMRPFMVRVFHSLAGEINPLKITVMTAVLQIAGGISCVLLVHKLGKRTMSLMSISLCAISTLSVGTYTLFQSEINQPFIPLVLFAVLFYSLSLGVGPIPWMLVSEVFPQRGRGAGGGISAAVFYLMAFLVGKTFLDLEKAFDGLHGVFFFYGSISVVGVFYMYFCLPETEGRSLEEIEQFFLKPTMITSKKHRKIQKSTTLT